MASNITLSCGKHEGKSFKAVEAGDWDYCKWVLSLPEPSRGLAKFADYLGTKHGGVLTFGANSGLTYAEAIEHESSYCDWALRVPSPSGPLKAFVKYLRAQSPRPRPSMGFDSDSDSETSNAKARLRAKKKRNKTVDDRDSEADSEESNQKSKKQTRKGLTSKKEKQGACKRKQKQTHQAVQNSTCKKIKMKDALCEKNLSKNGAACSDDNTCKICMDDAIQTCFFPCGHMMACVTCGNLLKRKECPLCRKTIKNVVRTFKA